MLLILSSGCAGLSKIPDAEPAKRLEAFSGMAEPSADLGQLPMPERAPRFVAVEVSGKMFACLPDSNEMAQYEKMKQYNRSMAEWSQMCYGAFEQSQAESASMFRLGAAAEQHSNVLAQAVDDGHKALQLEREARIWDNIKHNLIEIFMAVGLGFSLAL